MCCTCVKKNVHNISRVINRDFVLGGHIGVGLNKGPIGKGLKIDSGHNLWVSHKTRDVKIP